MSLLTGKTAIVTGVASGLGKAIAHECAKAGARVIGCDINEAGTEEMAEIGSFYLADVSVEREVMGLIDEVLEAEGTVDVMINNAGIEVEASLLDTTEEEFDRLVAVNLKGVFFGCKHAVRAMLQSGGGAIVNVASILALVGDGLLAAYCATKGGVLALTRAVAVEYGAHGIRCNALCPGDIDTPLVQAYFNATGDPEQRRAEVEAQYPIRRIASPDEVARAAIFLASDAASFISGQPLVVDGGLLAKVY